MKVKEKCCSEVTNQTSDRPGKVMLPKGDELDYKRHPCLTFRERKGGKVVLFRSENEGSCPEVTNKMNDQLARKPSCQPRAHQC